MTFAIGTLLIQQWIKEVPNGLKERLGAGDLVGTGIIEKYRRSRLIKEVPNGVKERLVGAGDLVGTGIEKYRTVSRLDL